MNPGIAESPLLESKTVERHINAIYSKLADESASGPQAGSVAPGACPLLSPTSCSIRPGLREGCTMAHKMLNTRLIGYDKLQRLEMTV
jgi:hypothetical protein